jgi:glutathione synthase/RimK-type ligase-like ATP-grasp enzyme
MWSSMNSKPAALALADQLGLRTPATLVTNDRAAAGAFLDGRDKIAKPVAGGGLTRSLDDAIAMASRSDGRFAAPAILQERLVAPEVRVYVVGDRTFAFEVRSPHLDYRAAGDAEVVALDATPDEVAAPLVRLAVAMGLEFCAADFKTACDGSLRFLEINTSPMFARFDQAAGGRLCDALVDWLCA